ncbi:BppU family phage baseplate upper protein [Pediococcus pentosaceus]|uniref:BppU family phage baseplate upper protein n=1 Tax=Pediococcus pentosaceus TaxID=1255 RepID=UPI001F5A0504|nr:BppU family phage baseplate upper protein [Pediococcus pentosaceus]MCI2961009.1 phage baseplate upper protein [Pediococcus pentosaceus]
MEVMTFNIDKDRRNLVDDKQNFSIDFHDSKYNWLQARQYEDGMRQVEVHVVRGDGSPVDLTGVNPMFEGWLPEGLYRIIDAKHSVMIDAVNGIFRFDFPAPAFQIAGSYQQAFFRLMKDGKSVATLEFSLEVLADKVISGLVPSDYITPYLDIYNKLIEIFKNADGKFDEQLIKWQNKFNETIGKLNGDYISIKTLADALDARLEELKKQVEANGTAKLSDIQPFIDELTKARGKYDDLSGRIDAMGAVDVDESMVSGGFVKSYFEPEIKRVKAELLPDVFTFTQMNDTHWETITRNKPEAYRSLNHIKNALAFADVSDLIILNGDNNNSDTVSLDGVKKDVETLVDVFLDEPLDYKTDRFIGIGNHDDGSTRRRFIANNLLAQDNYLHDAYFREAYRTGELLNGETRNKDSLYFYKDYPDKKIRFILIDTNDIPEGVNDANGSQKFDRWGTHTVRQEQLNWLANVALANVPSDYHVVVMGHTPLNANYEGGWHDTIDNDDIRGYHNLTLVADVLNAFRDGGKAEINSTDTNFPLNITADFTTQGPRNLVGYFCGHTHRDAVTTYNKLSIIEVACSVFYDNVKSRFVETATEDGFDVIQIDTTNRNVNIHGFGYCENRSVKY